MADVVGREFGRDIDAARMPHGRARTHSAVVKVLRIVLPATMVGVVALLAGLVGTHAIRRQQAAHQDSATPIRMINPRFFGRDNRGRAYILAAREAARDEQAFQVVLLTYPTLNLGIDEPKPTRVSADSGVYHEDTRMLLLTGHIRGDDPKLANIATDRALVNTKTGDIVGAAAVANQAKVGDVSGRSFQVKDKGDRVIFRGGVHARLKQH